MFVCLCLCQQNSCTNKATKGVFKIRRVESNKLHSLFREFKNRRGQKARNKLDRLSPQVL